MVKATTGAGEKIRICPAFSRSCMDAIESAIAASGMYSSKSDFLLSSIRSFQGMASEELADSIRDWKGLRLSTEDLTNRANARFDDIVRYYTNEYAKTYPGPSKEQITAFVPPVLFGISSTPEFIKEELEYCAKASVFIMIAAVMQDVHLVNDVWSVRFPTIEEGSYSQSGGFTSRRVRVFPRPPKVE